MTPLRQLFDLPGLTGQVVASIDTYPLIDQRFIDYLNAQPQDISRMHWRQFELLVGEFFRRNGYEVRITAQTHDGGIDVYAVRDTNSLGPERVVVQANDFGMIERFPWSLLRLCGATWMSYARRGVLLQPPRR